MIVSLTVATDHRYHGEPNGLPPQLLKSGDFTSVRRLFAKNRAQLVKWGSFDSYLFRQMRTLERSDNFNTEANQKSLNRSGEHH